MGCGLVFWRVRSVELILGRRRRPGKALLAASLFLPSQSQTLDRERRSSSSASSATDQSKPAQQAPPLVSVLWDVKYGVEHLLVGNLRFPFLRRQARRDAFDLVCRLTASIPQKAAEPKINDFDKIAICPIPSSQYRIG